MAKEVKKRVVGKDVIGIDETHNGFHLNHSFGTNLPLVTTGFLMRNYPGSQKANLKYERKGRVFIKEGISAERLAEKASWYLNKNHDFYYNLISQRSAEQQPLHVLRARGISHIVETFFNQYSLDEGRTIVVLDKINDLGGEMNQIIYLAGAFLTDAGIGASFMFREHADLYNQAVKTADRIGYYILGLRFKGPRSKWPYRSRRVPFSPQRMQMNFEEYE